MTARITGPSCARCPRPVWQDGLCSPCWHLQRVSSRRVEEPQPEPRQPRCIAYLSTTGHSIVLESTDDALTFTEADVDAAVEGVQAGRRKRAA